MNNGESLRAAKTHRANPARGETEKEEEPLRP